MTARATGSAVRARVLGAGAAAVAVAALSGGLTYATWGAGTSAAGAAVLGGALDVGLVGTAVWTGDVGDGSAVPLPLRVDGTTVDHLASAGDVLTYRQDVRVTLAGGNLAARVLVRWDQLPDLTAAPGAVATYVVTTPDGARTSPVVVGEAADLPVVLDSATVAAWPSDVWTVTVTLALPGDDALVVAPDQAATEPRVSLGTLALELEQVRTGQVVP